MLFDERTKTKRLGAALALGVCLAGCDGITATENDGWSEQEWRAIQDIKPLHTPMPRNPYNKQDQDPKVAKLGQMLFYELDYAEPITVAGPSGKMGEAGKVGCVTCHDPKKYFIDSRPDMPLSHGRNFSRRHTPTMVNTGWYEWWGWTARFDSMVMHGSGVMGVSATPLYYAHYIYKKYKQEYEEAFPNNPLPPELDANHPEAARFPATGGPKANAEAPDGPWEKMTADDRKAIMQIQANMGRVWDTYPRMLVSRNSPFEKYASGQYDALTPRQKIGLGLFIGKAACNDCHNGPLLSDSMAHNLGVKTPMGQMHDQGKFADLKSMKTHLFNGMSEFSDNRELGKQRLMAIKEDDMSMIGAFRTPMLLNIAETAPYFHTGEMKTLEDVVRFYNRGGGEPGTFAGTKDPRLKPLGLTEDEIGALVDFMKSLTGDPAPKEWTEDIAKH